MKTRTRGRCGSKWWILSKSSRSSMVSLLILFAARDIQLINHTDGSTGISEEQAAALRALLRQVGPEDFFEETMDRRNMTPGQIGSIFGLNPALAVEDEETFLRLLGVVVMRAFYRRQKLPQFNNIDDAAELLKRSRKIMVITGAGISTSLGIPDFRSRGTGFYEKIRAMGYSDPEEVFDIRNFDEDPRYG